MASAAAYMNATRRCVMASAACLFVLLSLSGCAASADEANSAAVFQDQATDALRVGMSYDLDRIAAAGVSSANAGGDGGEDGQSGARASSSASSHSGRASGVVAAVDAQQGVVAVQLDADSRSGYLRPMVYLECGSDIAAQLRSGDPLRFSYQLDASRPTIAPTSLEVWKKLI